MTATPPQPESRIHIPATRLSGWRAVAAIVVGVAVLVAMAAFLALSFLFIVLPTMIIGAVAYYLLPKRPTRGVGDLKAGERTENAIIIDAHYTVGNNPDGKLDTTTSEGANAPINAPKS